MFLQIYTIGSHIAAKRTGQLFHMNQYKLSYPEFTGRLLNMRMENCTQQERRELAAVCADLAFIWKKDRIDSTA